MTTKETGGPVYPHEFKYGDGTAARADGVTMRDLFAATALHGFLASGVPQTFDWDHADRAAFSYAQSDAMLQERSK